jgi:SAM-dependent methyltransferase
VAISWKVKAAVQTGLSATPDPERLNLWFQRRITHGLPPSDDRILEKVGWARHHVAEYVRVGPRAVSDSTFYEFGAGWDFAGAFAQRALGVPRQLLLDIRRLGRVDIALAAVASLDRLMPEFHLLAWEHPIDGAIEDVLGVYGIEYDAPADARATTLRDGAIDCITSTDTLEHIPPADIASILHECKRILADDGVMTFRVDYRDHWAYFDPRITTVNMLRYTQRQWARYNPSLNYQNRLRHEDYLRLFDEAGFIATAVVCEEPKPGALRFVAETPMPPEFQGYAPEALVVPSATFTLLKG